MPPDFDQLAIDLATRAGQSDVLPHIKAALRLVWNARGAADEDAVLVELNGPTPECLRAAGAIRILNR